MDPTLWGALFPRPRPRVTNTRAAMPWWSPAAYRPPARRAWRPAARLRAGAGLVTIASPSEALSVNAASSLAVMVRPVDGAAELAEFLADKRRNAVVLGPGGGVGQAMREQVEAALASDAAVVLDADALTSFVPAALAELIAKRANRNVVLTPHDGEFARLFKAIDEDPYVNAKLEKARASGPDQRCRACCSRAPIPSWPRPMAGPRLPTMRRPTLATAGSGDVLAGMIGGLMAQGMPAFEAASAAVWLHGEAATEFGPGPDRRGPSRGPAGGLPAAVCRSCRP